MIFNDTDYKIDCENKIDYINLVSQAIRSNNYYIHNTDTSLSYYHNNVYVVKSTNSFYTRDCNLTKEISPGIWKIVLILQE